MYLGIPQRLPDELDGGFDATFERLRRWFRARGVPAEEAADLAQEVIARALVHLHRHGYDPEVEVTPLLNTIGRNLLIDRARSGEPNVVPFEAAEHVDHSADPIDEVTRAAARRAVRAAIGELSSRHRSAMLLTLDGLTPAEIADHFGIQRNAADALLHRARRRLADRLRASVGAILGLGALLGLRVRAGARRSLEMVRHVDAASSGIAAHAFAAALIVGMVGFTPAPPRADVPFAAAEPRAASIAAAHDAGTDAEAVSAVQEPVRKSSEPRASFERTVRNPVTGREHHAGARVWYEPGPDGDGLTGSAIEDAIASLCATGTVKC